MPNGIKPPRTPWGDFPDAVLHASETAVKTHPAYWAAKTGDFDAAVRLVSDTISIPAAMAIGRIAKGRNVLVVSVHAFEQAGVNAIPEALAEQLYYMNGLQPDGAIVQANEVGHTGASGFSRLARQAKFTGPVAKRRLYFLVDDFIGQGGTLANLRGYIESAGGHVIGASALTGRADSAKLSPDRQLLERL